MDISSLFVNSFRPPKFVELSSDVIVPLSFPGGCTVPSVEGRHLSNESSWKELRADLFVSSEEAIHSLTSISTSITELISVSLLVSHSNGKCRRVSIRDEMGYEQAISPGLHTFVPVAVLMGLLLMNLHKFEVSKKLRFATLATQSLEKALEVYPKISRDRIMSRDCNQHVESGLIADEYDEAIHAKYKQSYRIMRYLVPPNIARTDLKRMISDGVPKSVADRVWNKKVLWLLCMHATDIPKVHIADLRGKYECHGLDIVELRALWYILPRWEGGSPKAEWRRALKSRLDDLIAKEAAGKISPLELRDSAYMGHEKLMIYDPDRALYRQFGVSVSSVGLPLGQRRKTVFTRVDLREASSLADSAGLLTTGSIPDQSPDTDEERERGHNSDDGPLSLSEKLSFSSPSESEGSSSISEEEEDNGGSDEQQMGSVNLTAEDVYLSVGQSLNKLSGEEEIDDDDTDKDTELDDLLNYEISLSCLDIDVDAVDSLSVCSEEIDIYGGCGEENHWRDRMSVGGIGSEAPRISTLLSSRGGPVCEVAKIPQPRMKLRHSKNKLKASLKGTPTDMLIENYRPFSFAVPLKKPLKRLNFIAGRSSHNSNQRNAAPSLDYFCDDDRELSPPRARRTFSQDEPLAGRSPVVRNAADSSSVREIGRTRHLPAVSHSSELELMYNHQSGVREHYELNPLVYPPGTDHDMNILNAGCVQYNVYSTTVNDHGFPVSMHRPFEFVDRDIQATGRLGTWHPDSKDDRTLVPHNLPTSTPALGSPQERGADCSLYGHDRRVEKSNSIIFSDDLSHNLKSKPVDESTLDYSLRSVDSVVKRPRSTCSTGSDSSSASIFSSFSAFSMHSVKSAAKYIFSSTTKREEDKYSDSNSKSKLVAAQLERERAKERQRDIERGFEHSVGGGDTCNIPSQVTGSETLSCSGPGNPLELPASVPLLRVAEIDDSVPRRVWNTFPAISTNSSRKGRFISAEEELVDNEIESEINNFIVPDELSPIILRQYGIEMGMREVNGIRQNALISLPALLSEIAINAETYTEDEDDYMDEISQNELGLWERGTGRAEPFEDIERLISSSGSANSLHLSPMSGVGMDSGVTLRSSSYSNGDDALRSGIANSCFAMSLSAVAIPVMELHSTLLSESNRDSEITTSEEKFIGTSEQNNATQRASLLTVNGRSSNDSVSPLTVREAEDLILYKEAHLAWSALSAGSLLVSKELATQLLLKFAEDPESVVEPLETLVLLLDKLGANVNATNENNMTPLHSLFSKPALGRFILSRGGDVLAKDDHGDSVLSMCAEYGYHWMLPAFINMHGREAKLLEDPHRAHEYAVILISLWGFGRRVRELVEDGIVCISAEEALDIMDTCRDRFEDMREPVETFELLESIVLKG